MIDFRDLLSEQYMNDELIRRILFGLQIKIYVGEKDVAVSNGSVDSIRKKKDITVFGIFPYSDTKITNFTKEVNSKFATIGQTLECWFNHVKTILSFIFS